MMQNPEFLLRLYSSTIPSISNYQGPAKITKCSLLCSNHFCRNWSATVTVNPVRSDIDFSLICLIDIARIDISPLAPCGIHVDYMD
ncbi:hypothetical protein D8674_042488 [Pyrus ussuriensis x Pyrus communis]|uniref:Uncharacterized protein n=1 Tax=Pyrus ussuriensis x Pyrus communis TaxID=2448454 RepID=A0A5N5H6R5_9ROSA|nr:hypothetical protein D8674_042488 [Pyrus ussuriensis x Pyrus communis]